MNQNKIIELINEKKYSVVKEELIELEEADIAEILENVHEENLIKIFRLLPKDIAATVFAELDVDTEQIIINSLTDKEAANIIENMYSDDAADLIDEMPANVVNRILQHTTAETRKDINRLLMYPEDSAGSIMTVEVADLKEMDTVKSAVNKLKKIEADRESIDYCFVLDKNRTLLGIVSLKQLLFASPNKLVKSLMDKDVIYLNVLDDQEEVARQFQKYNLNVMPVVDKEKRLVGIVTSDDVMDVIEEEATEDIKKMAAIIPNDKPYNRTSAFEIFKARIPWLLLLMVSATFTSQIIKGFEDKLAIYTILTAFIPMLMDTGGNAGGQTSASIIRALSLNDIEYKDTFKIMFKEFRVAILCSIVLGVVNFTKMIFIDRVNSVIALTVCITLALTLIIAKVIGCLLPLGAKKIGIDPAVMASPFITTIVDACSLIVYFKIAVLLLHI